MNEKEIKKITSLALAKYRRKYGLFLVEGAHLVNELLLSDWQADSLIISENAAGERQYRDIIRIALSRKMPVDKIDERLFKKLSKTETPQGILALAPIPVINLEDVVARKRIIITDGISDPGNMGTIIRTAAALGFDGMITTAGSADVYSPKVIRATQGAIFKIVFAEHIDPERIIEEIRHSHTIFALSSHEGQDISNIVASNKMALIVGAEIAGINSELLAAAHHQIHIPMTGPVESLNAAIAAGIAMFELGRGRSK